MSIELIKNSLREAEDVLKAFVSDDQNIERIQLAAILMVETMQNGGKIISCGNGGSMSDAMHFAEELSGRFRNDRKAMPVFSISDPTHITCVGNDYGFDSIFSRYIEGVGKKGDLLLGISTSGNSLNVLKAAETATGKGMKVISLTGKDGGKLKNMSDININVSHYKYSDRIQEVHIKIIHILIELIEKLTCE
ncbi:MAG: D-sedoheptulose 7-phosphate isomerase [Marinilabiliaceae bacterium]|nr:D-sedoheptulose 7-phosphate isomerase [Marinilabiliaceae bacterium]